VYLERFKNQVDVIEHYGGFTSETGLVGKMLPSRVSLDSASPDLLAVATRKAKERYLAVAFILGSDRVRYGKLIEDMENSYIKGDDKNPAELTCLQFGPHCFRTLPPHCHDYDEEIYFRQTLHSVHASN
jgi:hypothetical protein